MPADFARRFVGLAGLPSETHAELSLSAPSDAGKRPQASKLTYEDYVTLPNDGRRYEILDGEMAVSPSPRVSHQRVTRRLIYAFERWLRRHDVGEIFGAPIDVVLGGSAVVVPDLVYVSHSRADIVTEKAIKGCPELLIEILSPLTQRHDRGAKMKIYARHGVERYWIVDADARSLEIYALREGAYQRIGVYRGADVVRCDLPGGLVLRIGEIWPKAGRRKGVRPR